MSNDFNIYEFGQMFDAALASNNPSVKKALRNFMMICAMIHAEDEGEAARDTGPFKELFKRLNDVERRLESVELIKEYNKYNKSHDHTWITNPYSTTLPDVGTPSTTGVLWSKDSTSSRNYGINNHTITSSTTSSAVESIEKELEKQLTQLLAKGDK